MGRLFLWRIGVIVLLGGAVVIASCGDGDETRNGGTGGPSRSFMMGISTLPRELSGAAYSETFDLAAANGEMVLIHRTPPWADFVPGADVSDATAKTTASEKDAISSKKLQLFFAIDPTDGSTGRDRLTDLPASLDRAQFQRSGRAVGVSHVRAIRRDQLQARLHCAGRRDEPLQPEERGGLRELQVAVLRGV